MSAMGSAEGIVNVHVTQLRERCSEGIHLGCICLQLGKRGKVREEKEKGRKKKKKRREK